MSGHGGLRPAATMLLLSLSGMAVGVALDCGMTPPALIAALCSDAPQSLAATLRFHAAVMPASYGLAVAGALVALALEPARGGAARRAAAGVLAVLLMPAGMVAGGWLAPVVAARLGAASGFDLLIAAMAAGMIPAAAAAAGIARAAGLRGPEGAARPA